MYWRSPSGVRGGAPRRKFLRSHRKIAENVPEWTTRSELVDEGAHALRHFVSLTDQPASSCLLLSLVALASRLRASEQHCCCAFRVYGEQILLYGPSQMFVALTRIFAFAPARQRSVPPRSGGLR